MGTHPQTQEKLDSVRAWHCVTLIIPIYIHVRGKGTRLWSDLHPDSTSQCCCLSSFASRSEQISPPYAESTAGEAAALPQGQTSSGALL